MAIQKTRGFVLKREDLRETSVILTAYTKDFGKLKFVSKGVRIPEQRFVSAYELFSLDEIVFYEKKKKNYFLLSQCELINYFPEIRKSLERISYASYLIELVEQVAPPGEENQRLYELLENSMTLLASKASPRRVARIFEIKLLSIIGLMPGLRACVACDKSLKNRKARFSTSLGGVLCEDCLLKDKGARPVLEGTVNFISHIDAMPFDKIKHVKVSTRVGSEVERILRNFINYHLDVRLKSLDFIRKINL